MKDIIKELVDIDEQAKHYSEETEKQKDSCFSVRRSRCSKARSISVGIRFSGQALMQAPQRIQADGSGNSRPLRASSAFCCRRITASSAFAIA